MMRILKNQLFLFMNDRSINSLAREYGVSVSSVAKWTKLYTSVSTEDGEVFTAKQIKELQKRNAILEEENLILKKSNCHIHSPLKERLKTVHILRLEHKISTLCRVLNVNRSSYYKHFYSPTSKRTLENWDIKSKILTIYTSSKKRLGYQKIMVRLNA